MVRDAIEAFTLSLTIDELAQEAEVPREAIIEAVQLAAVAVSEYYSAPDPDMDEIEMDAATELSAAGDNS